MFVVKKRQYLDTTQFEYNVLQQYHNKVSSIRVSYHNQKLALETDTINVIPKIYRFETDKMTKYYLLCRLCPSPVRGQGGPNGQGGPGGQGSNSENHRLFCQKLIAVDNQFIQDALSHREWFNTKVTLGLLEKIYAPIVQTPNDNFPFPELLDKSHYYMKVRIPVDKDGMILCHTGDLSGNIHQFTIDTLEQVLHECQSCRLTIRCDGLWFAGGKYGSTWGCVRLDLDTVLSKVTKKIDFKQYCFMSDDED